MSASTSADNQRARRSLTDSASQVARMMAIVGASIVMSGALTVGLRASETPATPSSIVSDDPGSVVVLQRGRPF